MNIANLTQPIIPPGQNHVVKSLYQGVEAMFTLIVGFLLYKSVKEKSGSKLVKLDGGLSPHNLPLDQGKILGSEGLLPGTLDTIL